MAIAQQILDSLQHIFEHEKHRIIFWYDAEGEFSDDISDLSLDGVTVLRLDELGALEVKIQIEVDDSSGSYILYAPYAQPENKDNWLLDIQLYSRVFFADRVSLFLTELELSQKSLRSHLSQRRKFLASKERVAQLKNWLNPQDGEREIDLKMLAVTLKAEQPDVDALLLKLFGECCEHGLGSGLFENFEVIATSWANLTTYELEDSFWQLLSERFSYLRDADHRSLRDFVFSLFATDFANAYRDELPSNLKSFVLPDRNLGRNASVFLANWRSHATHFESYTILSDFAAKELGIDDILTQCDMEPLLEVMTFSLVEKHILSELRNRVLAYANGEKSGSIAEISRIRRDGHWTRALLAENGINHFAAAYHAIDRAAQLFELRWKMDGGISFGSARAGFERYCQSLYEFDQSYRLFHEHAEHVQQKGWDVLKSLNDAVEGCYAGWFLPQLTKAWGEHLEGTDGFLDSWCLMGVLPQQKFYEQEVAPLLKKNPKSCICVVISDALRYEAGQEVTESLLAKDRFVAEMKPMLGVLPSYTALGMAALLPHKELSYRGTKSSTVMVDGQYTSSTEHRSEILKKHQGIALSANDIMDMTQAEGRELVKNNRVIYLYHDVIDATGDKRSSEGRTFSATRRAISELVDVTSRLINSLNASTVLITADHGYLYTEEPLEEADKSKLKDKPDGALEAKKRYIIGRELGQAKNIWLGSTEVTAGMSNGAEFWLPKGAGRFHFVGGARYVHGGAMPQEVILPVISAKRARGKQAGKGEVRKVDISALEAGIIRITNTIRRFEFIQLDPVSDKVLPRTVEVFIREGDTMLSNIAKATFDSTSDGLEERKRSVQLTVMSGQYSKDGDYCLVMRDAESNVELHSLPVSIDLAFGADF